MTHDRPFVILNAAVTADGKTDTIARQGATISSAQDLERVDRLRAESDAVMVGGQTLLGDDPRLTVKSEVLRAERRARGLEENPVKVGIVTNATLRLDSRFLTAGPARVMLFTTERTSAEQIARLRERGAEVCVMGDRTVHLRGALECLSTHGVKRLLVEGGGTLNAKLLRQKLVDEIYVHIAPLIFSGANAPTLADGAGLERKEALGLHLKAVENLGEGGVGRVGAQNAVFEVKRAVSLTANVVRGPPEESWHFVDRALHFKLDHRIHDERVVKIDPERKTLVAAPKRRWIERLQAAGALAILGVSRAGA